MQLSKKINDLLNKQIKMESENAVIYSTIQAYFNNLGLEGFSKYFKTQSKGERGHAKLVAQYVLDKGDVEFLDVKGFAKITGSDVIKTCKSIMAQYYKTELATTESLSNIFNQASESMDVITCAWLRPLLIEQIEEEKSAMDLKQQVERIMTTEGLNLMDKEI